MAELRSAKPHAIILPGSKNTLADLRWLKASGLAAEIAKLVHQNAHSKMPVVGICGGYQMLGDRIIDPTGSVGEIGEESGLGLLPMVTRFTATKSVTQTQACITNNSESDTWNTYEIHMGQTQFHSHLTADETGDGLVKVVDKNGDRRDEGVELNHIWGTYLHGLFESGIMREKLTNLAKIHRHQRGAIPWSTHQQKLYDTMAILLENHLDLEPIRQYLSL
ncbi:MAG: hypothetical protein ACFCBU_01185 [Cyanophyceae cyanobacterium]